MLKARAERDSTLTEVGELQSKVESLEREVEKKESRIKEEQSVNETLNKNL